MQDIFGGKVCGVPLEDGNYHCFNVVGDCLFDLTSEQFGDQKLDYDNCPEQERSVHFMKTEKRERYEKLKAALDGMRRWRRWRRPSDKLSDIADCLVSERRRFKLFSKEIQS